MSTPHPVRARARRRSMNSAAHQLAEHVHARSWLTCVVTMSTVSTRVSAARQFLEAARVPLAPLGVAAARNAQPSS